MIHLLIHRKRVYPYVIALLISIPFVCVVGQAHADEPAPAAPVMQGTTAEDKQAVLDNATEQTPAEKSEASSIPPQAAEPAPAENITPEAAPQAGPAEQAATLQQTAVTPDLPQQDTQLDFETMIKGLKDRGLISDEEAERYLEASKRNPAAQLPASDRDKYIDEISRQVAGQIKGSVQSAVKDELKADILKEARLGNWLTPEMPEWASKIRLTGDIRVRYQGDYFASDNDDQVLSPSNPTQLMNTTEDRDRMRLRVRLNTLIQVADQVDAGVTISTGNTTTPVSANVTFGDYQNNKSVVLNQAWMRYRPMPELSLWAGRMPNPWFYTDLVWDDNLNFDGVALQFDTQLGRPLRTFLTVGAFPIQEVELSSHDKWLYGMQTGIKLNAPEIISVKLSGAYYYYTNMVGKPNNPQYPGLTDWTAPQFQQMGNTLFDIDPSSSYKLALAADYHELDYTGMIDVVIFNPVHLTLTGDYVKNIGFNTGEVISRTGPGLNKDTKGYQVIFGVGYKEVSDFGQWRCSAARKYVGKDCVLDAFTDSNFHGGGTNAQGYILKYDLGLTRNVWGSIQWYSADEIDGPKIAIDTLQVDMNVKF